MPTYAPSGPLMISSEHRAWEMLLELLDGCELLTIHRVHAPDEEEGAATWSLGMVRQDGRRQFAVAGTVAEAVRSAANPDAVRTCRRCKKSKPLGAFAGSKEGKEGKLPRCRACECARVKRYQQKKRRQRRRGGRAGEAGEVVAAAGPP